MPSWGGKLPDVWAQVAFYTSLGFIIPGGVVAGYVVGWIFDQTLHTGKILGMIGALLGAAGGVYEVIQILTRAERGRNGKNSPG